MQSQRPFDFSRSNTLSTGFDVLLSARTNWAIVELAHAITSALRETGHDARIVEDRIPPVRNDRAILVIGPHDVYPHLSSIDGAGMTASLARTILVCCEQPETPAWNATLGFAAKAGYLFDVSDVGVAAFSELGLPAHRFQLGYHESFDNWHRNDQPRPIDVVFLGSRTPRRLEILASGAGILAQRHVDLRLTERMASKESPVAGHISAQDKHALLARAKILMDVHPDNGFAFSWLRAVDAICNGCILVSEESLGTAPLVAGTHFVTGSAASLPMLVDVLLRNAERLNRIRHAAYQLLRDELPLQRSIRPIVDASASLPGRPPHGRDFAIPRPPVEEVARTSGTDEKVSKETQASSEVTDVLEKQNAVLKKLFFDLRLLRRQVAHLALTVNEPSAPLVGESSTPAVPVSEPEVTVIVTVHNYGRFVRDALASAVASERVALEIVVVDDASIDNSRDVVHEFMSEHADVPITFFEQRVNTGAQRARNLAFARARGPFAFVLDADNLVYPRGIAKLRDALLADPAAGFAYGMIERFAEDKSLGLMGTEAWDPALLAHRSYIDAMALVRVDAWKQVGGYVTDPLLELGWEDYDLWLSLVVAGYHGAHVREIIGRYRIHGVSSLTMTTLDTADLMEKLRHRHADFFASVSQASP
jgi:GT2 family glycosyltransferase